ncbi:hypothetical protein [Nocardia sp. NPDC057353]|uniref:hypothetical protein n=1 Tax=Nocardia sp. NPDC057353 TaxID=3346104 RepID=UPI003639C4DA
MTAEAVLDFADHAFLNFRHFDFDQDGRHGFRWVDSKKYIVQQPGATDAEILRALIDSTAYRDNYIGGGIEPGGTRHGPYWLRNISVDSYRDISRDEAVAVVDRWLRAAGSVPDELMTDLIAEVFEPIGTATAIYELRDLGEAAMSDLGLSNGEFHELVLLDRANASLRMIVASDD